MKMINFLESSSFFWNCSKKWRWKCENHTFIKQFSKCLNTGCWKSLEKSKMKLLENSHGCTLTSKLEKFSSFLKMKQNIPIKMFKKWVKSRFWIKIKLLQRNQYVNRMWSLYQAKKQKTIMKGSFYQLFETFNKQYYEPE